MRVKVKKTVARGFMGDETRTKTVTVEGVDEVELLQLLQGRRAGRPALPGPAAQARSDGGGEIEVTPAMREAARAVFLSPERVAALADTLAEIYRAMEQARRRGT